MSKILAILILFAASISNAYEYPAKSIRLIVPAPSGDFLDFLARTIGQELTEQLGKPIVIDNRPSASGIAGLAELKNSNSDGYTIALATRSNITISPHVYKNLPYDPIADFRGIILLTNGYLVYFASAQSSIKNMRDMISTAQKNSGKLTMAINGYGTGPHMSMVLMARQAHFDTFFIAYKGMTPSILGVVSDQVNVGAAAAITLAPFVNSGKIQPLAVTATSRLMTMPELPTIAETVPGYSWSSWSGVITTAKTSDASVNLLNKEIAKVLQNTKVRSKIAASLAVIPNAETAKQFDHYIKAEYAASRILVRYAKIPE
jgi:tripartite-type tricarboxylate transporter receptor subunit TctC